MTFITRSLILLLATVISLIYAQHQSDSADTVPFDAEVMASLKSAHRGVSDQAALDISAMIRALSQDPETITLVQSMKEGDGQQTYETFAKSMSSEEIVTALAQTLEEMKALEMLFENPHRAVVEMNNEGMVPQHRLDEYTNDPALLEMDTRRSFHFTCVSLAAAGGYL